MPNEIAAVGPEWLVALAVALLVLNWVGRVLAEASESWAKVLGPLGRRWRERGIARQEARAEASAVRMADLADVTRQRDYLDVELGLCRKSNELRATYIEYDAGWHRQTRLRAIEAGCDLPEHQSYLQWREAQS